jgi:hypothetical protein
VADADHQHELTATPLTSAAETADVAGMPDRRHAAARTALASDGTTFLRDSGAISQVKVGVNYRFSAGPVIAQY